MKAWIALIPAGNPKPVGGEVSWREMEAFLVSGSRPRRCASGASYGEAAGRPFGPDVPTAVGVASISVASDADLHRLTRVQGGKVSVVYLPDVLTGPQLRFEGSKK